MHIRTGYITLATLLGIHHPFMVSMGTLLDNWGRAEMELPGLLAPIPHGTAACIFWRALQFHHYFHVEKKYLGQGPPPMPQMTKLMEQL